MVLSDVTNKPLVRGPDRTNHAFPPPKQVGVVAEQCAEAQFYCLRRETINCWLTIESLIAPVIP